MKVALKNIGKISDTEIELNGVTVIGGENDTGKSTVNRAVYVVCNGFYHSGGQIEDAREDSVSEQLRKIPFFRRDYASIRVKGIARDILAERDKYRDPQALTSLLQQIPMYDQFGEAPSREALPEIEYNHILEGVIERLNVPDELLFQSVMQNMFHAEFHGQINRFGTDTAQIRLTADEEEFVIQFENNRVKEINGLYDFPAMAVYLDDSVALDAVLDASSVFMGNQGRDHHAHLMRLLGKKSDNIVDEAVAESRLKRVGAMISQACGGDLIFTKYGRLGYRRHTGAPILDVRNMSAGVKSFAIIKLLLLNHTLDDNGILLMDEPENNLHPEWQLLFAELLILLQKEFNLRILLNTHSPYFLNAVEVYAAKHGVQDKCKYYLATANHDDACFEDVTSCAEAIYAKLARPFQKLEDEESDLL